MYDVTSLTITGLHVIQRISLYFSQCVVRTSVPWNQAFKYAYLWVANLRSSKGTKDKKKISLETYSKYSKYAVFKISSIQHIKNSVLMCWSMAPQHIWPFDFILHPVKILKRISTFSISQVTLFCRFRRIQRPEIQGQYSYNVRHSNKIVEYQINLKYD